ncbi:MAG: hypothetical protein R3358_01480 [Woeseiaceae bacterium]|nr:hypothetical protein [Woeseiaceae bacterium]
MSYEITCERRPDYLVFRVTGENTAENVQAYLSDILALCREHDCFRILVHECLEGRRLKVDDVFDIASEGAMKALGVFQAIAYVDERMGDMSYFMETVAINRGMPIKAFRTVAHAEHWLEHELEGTGEHEIFLPDESGDRR